MDYIQNTTRREPVPSVQIKNRESWTGLHILTCQFLSWEFFSLENPHWSTCDIGIWESHVISPLRWYQLVLRLHVGFALLEHVLFLGTVSVETEDILRAVPIQTFILLTNLATRCLHPLLWIRWFSREVDVWQLYNKNCNRGEHLSYVE